MIWIYALVWFVLYTIIAFYVSKNYSFENINISGPILSIRSRAGLGIITYLADRFRGFWNIWGVLGVILAIITGFGSIFFVGLSVWGLIITDGNIGIQGPTDMLVIPGVNRFLPVSATPEIIAGLVIGMVVHEAGHAIYCKTGDIKIKSTGLIFASLIPIGAFVEPDEKEQNEAEPIPSLKMFSAGIMNNYAVFIITLILLISSVSMFITPINGAGIGEVIDKSPADEVGINSGDVITHANGVPLKNNSELTEQTELGLNNVTIKDESYKLPNKIYVTESPSKTSLPVGSNIISINNQNISNTKQFAENIEKIDNNTAEIKLDNNKKINIEIGAYVTSKENSNVSNSLDIKSGESTFIYSIDNERVYKNSDISEAISGKNGENVSITYGYKDNIRSDYYTIPDKNGSIGLVSSSNPSGISTSDLGVYTYPSESFYDIITFKNADSIPSILSHIYTVMILPLGSLIPGVQFDLPGFTPFIQNFYTTTFNSGIMSYIVFTSTSIMLWTSWINFNLAIFNCMPTFLLDGGHILNSLSIVLLPDSLSNDQKKYIRWTIASIILIMLLSLMFLPLIL